MPRRIWRCCPGARSTPTQYKIGGDIFRVVEAATQSDPALLDVPLTVARLYAIITYIDFAERAEAVADEIRKNRPHFIGLQQVPTVLKQTPGVFLSGNPQPAEDILTVSGLWPSGSCRIVRTDNLQMASQIQRWLITATLPSKA